MSDVEITQADRELVANIAEACEGLDLGGNDVAAIRQGIWDNDTEDLGVLLQIAAKTRLASEQSTELEQLRAEVERLATATSNLIISCTRTMVGGSDGGTYIVGAPTGNCLKAASDAVTSARTFLTGETK